MRAAMIAALVFLAGCEPNWEECEKLMDVQGVDRTGGYTTRSGNVTIYHPNKYWRTQGYMCKGKIKVRLVERISREEYDDHILQ